MEMSAKARVCALLVGAILQSANAADNFDSRALQLQFATAENLTLVNSSRNLPADARQKLDHIPWLQQLGLADFGGEWAAGDAPAPNLPLGRHLFSGLSDELAAVVFQTHGHVSRVWLVLAARNSRDYCLFELPTQNLASIRLSEIQLLIRPDRSDTRYRKVPTCVHESTTNEFESPQ